MGRRPRATWPGKERQEDQQPRSKTEVSAWLQDRLDTLNRASVGGWFDEVLRQARTMKNADWWKLVYARGAELFGGDFQGIRSVTVAYWGVDRDVATQNRLKWRARRPGDGDHL